MWCVADGGRSRKCVYGWWSCSMQGGGRREICVVGMAEIVEREGRDLKHEWYLRWAFWCCASGSY